MFFYFSEINDRYSVVICGGVNVLTNWPALEDA